MKSIIKLAFFILFIGCLKGYSQCPSGDLTTNPYICGYYGDGNGTTIWDWEASPTDATKFCLTWQARTQVGNALRVMGSPFYDSQTGALYQIAQNKDYTRAKGWELLRRDFGCNHEVSYPNFILYNKYTGLMRVFVYQTTGSQQYSQIVLQIEPVNTPYPATTSLGDPIIVSPEDYKSSNSESPFGKSIISVSEQSGNGGWLVAEFNTGFDPNIEDAIRYRDAALKISIFGEANSTITADIKGTGVTGPKIYDFSYASTSPGKTSPDNQTIKFTAQGEKFVKFSKTITETREGINKAANNIVNSLANTPYNSTVKGRIKSAAFTARQLTQDNQGFGKLLGQVANVLGAGGQVIKLVGGVIGLFSGSGSSVAPTFTTYNLELHGEITAKNLASTFIIRVPGTVQSNPSDNATYYRCPLGIFNIVNKPEADVVNYERATWTEFGKNFSSDNYPSWSTLERKNFVSYRLRNNLDVSFNSGAGLELVSAQAAIVGEVLSNSDKTGPAYDLLEEYSETSFGGSGSLDSKTLYKYNYMLPDLQSGILEVVNYDPDKKLHTFQTPYYNLGCLNGLTFNARAETNVFLRIKAILKRKNDLENTPIIYIRDYAITTHNGEMENDLREYHRSYLSYLNPTPYSNYTEIPLYETSKIDRVINGVIYASSQEEVADNSITTENSVVVTSEKNVVFRAGGEINLEDGFETEGNTEFEATLKISELVNINCSTPVVQAFVPTLNGGSCYNTAAKPAREATKPNNTEVIKGAEEVKVYPIPTNGKLVITGINNSNNAIITILDQSGRTIQEIRSASYEASRRIDLDVSALTNGVYFVKIQTLTQTITKKIVVSK